MCLYPKLIKNRKYTSNKKNGGNIPPMLDERVKYVPIGCQECIECRKQKSREWQIRLLEDIKTRTNGKFVTLTFSNESILKLTNQIKKRIDEQIDKLQHAKVYTSETAKQVQRLKSKRSGYGLDNEIATYATRLFVESWRKKFKKSIRHWLVTELGHNGTNNIHLHGIIWTNQTLDTVEKIWKHGFVWKGKSINGKLLNYVNARTVNYIVKYVNKIDHHHRYYKSKILTSPGIGSNYTKTGDSRKNSFNGEKTSETYKTPSGHKISLPIYWRNKIYSEQEREKLWLQRLDKQERWVCGERVDISISDKEYYRLLTYYRKKNTSMGYGSNEQNWDRLQYELDRRDIMQKTRLAKAYQHASGGPPGALRGPAPGRAGPSSNSRPGL